MKVHLHDDQFDGIPHPWCGRGKTAVSEEDFEATEPALRCRICDAEWFPSGQTDWHYKNAVSRKMVRQRGEAIHAASASLYSEPCTGDPLLAPLRLPKPDEHMA